MLRVGFAAAPRRILLLGAHPDDIEIGCAGMLSWLLAKQPSLEIGWVVFSATGARRLEARRSAEVLTDQAASCDLRLFEFRDGFLPYQGFEVKGAFEELKSAFRPDLILTHARADAHQDHRLIAELTWNTFRDHLILEYEIPKYDGDLGAPSVFVHLSAEQAAGKARHLLDHYPSQHSRSWFREDLFMSIMRLRGMECNAPDGYAEAFYSRKLVF